MALVLTPDGGDHLVIAYLSELKPACRSDLSRSFQCSDWWTGTMTINPHWPWPLHCLYRVWARILFWFWLMEHHNRGPVTVACIWCVWDDIDVHQCQEHKHGTEPAPVPGPNPLNPWNRDHNANPTGHSVHLWFWLMEHYNGTSDHCLYHGWPR